MPISRFDEGTLSDALVVYYSGAESPMSKTGDVIDTLDSVYGNMTCQLVQMNDLNNQVTHDGVTMVGQVPAFIGTATNTNGGMEGTLSGTFNHQTNGATLVTLEQRYSKSGRYGWSIGDGSGADIRAAVRGGDPNTSLRIDNTTWGNAADLTTNTDANVVMMRTQNGNPTAHVRTDTQAEVANNKTNGLANIVISSVALMNGPAAGDAFQGKIAIAVLYNRRLTDQECLDVMELMEYWRDNGEAPGGAPEPNTTFGPVSTNDDPSVTGWQWEESADGNRWANVGTILTDISGETTTTLTVNSAPIEADQTLVRCKAFSAKEPAPDGVVSHSAILTVQA
jgi:hypothetical protein